MDNPGLPEELWSRLSGGLWHATSETGFRSIVSDGLIQVSTSNRYRNSFCRSINSVCLFDFGDTAEDKANQSSNWFGWFGFQQDNRVAIWLEISRTALGDRLTDAGEAYKLWNRDGWRSKMFIPGVEACGAGPILREEVVSTLFIDRHDRSRFIDFRFSWDEAEAELDRFRSSLPPPPPESSVVRALQAARQKRIHQ